MSLIDFREKSGYTENMRKRRDIFVIAAEGEAKHGKDGRYRKSGF